MKEFKLTEDSNPTESATSTSDVFKSFNSNLNNGSTDFTANTTTGTTSKTTKNSNLPRKPGVWGAIKSFLFYEIDLNKPIVLELTPKEEKVLSEVHNFLFQEVKFPELHNMFFK